MKKKNLSIIIPVLNEEKNIAPLIYRIHEVLTKNRISYEVIFVDDHSTDNTLQIIHSFTSHFPVRVFTKVGKKGKADSLKEGFSKAIFDTVAMIDADMQYNPIYLPRMLAKIKQGADIVIAKRTVHKEGFIRKLYSKTYATFFLNLLHNFDTDIQSGLKVFKKEVIERIYVKSSKWAFDLEFLLKARDAGYKITDVAIVFNKRVHGKPKINVFTAIPELAMSTILLKFRQTKPIAIHSKNNKNNESGFHYKGHAFVPYTLIHKFDNAFLNVTRGQKVLLTGIFLAVLAAFIINWHLAITAFFVTLTILYFADLLFNFFIIFRSFFKDPEIKVSQSEINHIADSAWPKYTIMCPLYKEWQVLPQFVKAINQLDYPKNKLQVQLLLEEDDTKTIEKVKAYTLPSHFDVIVVPHSQPKTKPKALNYGLQFAKGEFVVVYDAEDIPDPLQLKKAVLAFNKAKENIICIQAKLNFYNPRQNTLTRLFTGEYSVWFDLVLTGLQSIHAPIPLGGTSNHFRTKDIKSLLGWDPFNVTEDADLGIRLAKKGYETAVLDSYTMEEANSDLKNWFRQRSRWIKGYMQTYFVHMRKPHTFLGSWFNPHLITFQLVIGGKILSMLINPVMWLLTIIYFIFRPEVGGFIQTLFPGPIFYMAAVSLFIGNALYLYYYMIGAAKREQWDIMFFILLTPIYWLMMSLAAGVALYEFIVKPHYWQKTVHGLHLQNKNNKDFTRLDNLLVDPAF